MVKRSAANQIRCQACFVIAEAEWDRVSKARKRAKRSEGRSVRDRLKAQRNRAEDVARMEAEAARPVKPGCFRAHPGEPYCGGCAPHGRWVEEQIEAGMDTDRRLRPNGSCVECKGEAATPMALYCDSCRVERERARNRKWRAAR